MNIHTNSSLSSSTDYANLINNAALAKDANVHSIASMLHFAPDLPSNSELIRFPTERRLNHKRWVCNISEHFKFVENKPHFLQIGASQSHSQYSLLCKLLALGNCDVIYFDCNFTKYELTVIRQLQEKSGTELVNSKQAFLLSITQQSKLA